MFTRSRLLLLGAFILGAAIAFGLLWWRSSVTYGVIHVESPEIYTRERLVNDRYNQDHWLRERLDLLDDVGDLSSGYLAVAVNVDAQVAVGSAGESAAPAMDSPKNPDSAAAGGKDSMPLPFQEDLALRMSIRDFLRQQILENMLDDRHDLSGNTVFGLKFDTSVIPGTNTRNPAYVKAFVSIHNYRDLIEMVDIAGIGQVRRYEADYYQGYQRQDWKKSAEYVLYLDWLKDFQARLNKVAASIVNQDCQDHRPIAFSWEYARQLSRSVFSLVAGLEPGNVIVAKPPLESATFIQIFPGELQNYVKVSVSASNVCAGGISITVTPRIENLYLTDRKSAEMGGLDEGRRSLVNRLIGSLNGDAFNLITKYRPAQDDWIDPKSNVCGIHAGAEYSVALLNEIDLSQIPDLLRDQEMELRNLRYDVADSLIALMSKYGARAYRSTRKPTKDLLVDMAAGDSNVKNAYEGLQLNDDHNEALAIWGILSATQPACVVEFPLGFFNFIDKIARSESYAYAVFPKSERKVFKLQELVQLAAGGGGGRDGVGKLSGMFGLAQALDSTDAVPLSIGYGDGAAGTTGQAPDTGATADSQVSEQPQGANFGWVILPEPGDNRLGGAALLPTQKSQLALISVPAFAKEITVRLETGWLDEDAQPIEELLTRYDAQEIRVPTDFDAVDSLLAFAGANRRPLVIAGELSPKVLRECAPAKILIPGFRLWQSTLVTIGSEQSDKITVLPNMEGIIAEFKSIPRVTSDGLQVAQFAAPVLTLPLRVWTSEGVTDPIDLRIERGRCELPPPTADQGTIMP